MTVRRVIWNDTVWEGGSITVALRLGPRIEPEIQIKKFAQLGSWETTTTGRKTPVVCLGRLGGTGILTRGLLGGVVR